METMLHLVAILQTPKVSTSYMLNTSATSVCPAQIKAANTDNFPNILPSAMLKTNGLRNKEYILTLDYKYQVFLILIYHQKGKSSLPKLLTILSSQYLTDMGITTFTEEHTSPVPPSRIFKASIVDSHNLIPKLMPQAIKSIQIIQGNGGAGSIKQINFAEG
ncbi:uncharacterized protein LOC111370924 [Olea europaea var. sylvestris]|uniref:uncharacterized protein LOC111370924 n=1 Tax=Olea europaea var. sylvestris TaxID=158386 RepID=UPI000C1D08B6|nr:uncharacterized protein LOC111370924 [Olea europaea var. sylvestris]